MKSIIDSTIVVIRSADERTHDVCRELVLKQVSASCLSIVQECPFEAALRKCYKIGIDSDAKWMVTVDADVLLMENSIEFLVQAAEQMPANYFQLEGRIFDKITGLYRQAGHRIYRTEYLREALKLIPQDGNQIRPEYYTLQHMGQIGYPSRRVAGVVGLHDFEQYYSDLYRKSFVHAIKHKWLVSSLIERCTSHLHQDADFLVILKGMWDGLTTDDTVSIDKNKFLDSSRNVLVNLGLTEKESVGDFKTFAQGFRGYFSEKVLEYHIPDFDSQDEPIVHVEELTNWFHKAVRHFDRHGPVKGSSAALGILLKRIGQYLDS